MSSTARAIVQAGWAFRVGDWLVEPSLNRVSRGDGATQLEFKAMDVLVYLAARAGELVDKRELQDAVWQTEFVSDNTLTRRIAELRDAFGDDAHSPRYIETIPKRGYRLIAPVTAAEEVDETVVAFPDRLPPERERPPYPGLFPFIEADAADFFGREAEVTALWRKITDRRLLAVVGPSGVGKSSLLRAGVVARVPPGWRAVICHPGETPVLELAQALTPEFAGKLDELQALLRFQDPDVALALVSRWRGRWGEALIVVDQFEELFTLTTPSAQQEFVALLRRLVDAAGIHVVLVLRDDFLYECHRFPELDPVLKDLTLVGPPVGAALRRALTEPAARRQYHFEGEPLVDEMVAEVERERGALPLIAFAASRMWELRDTERRLLTREAYEQIGGVGGALAQHAEATLEAIGPDRRPIVRELFRNLVTAQGTRAVRDVDELVSVFGEGSRAEARSVLRALTDARLLTSFEGEAGEGGAGGPRHRVEVVHESLLRAWPRLVRWQAQDAEGALLRDQLRQAAHLWEEKGRPDDLLWTGASYREFAVWRERYPGALSDLEEAFARSMTELADRRRRRRRAAATSAIVVLLAVAAALSLLWHRSVQETRRAEAAKLLALAQARLADDPTEALALTTVSLEVADTREAREFVMRVLWTAPLALELMVEAEGQLGAAGFSPDGRHVALAGYTSEVKVWSDDGRGPTQIAGHLPTLVGVNMPAWVAGDLFVTGRVLDPWLPGFGDRVQLWSLPEQKLLRTLEFGSPGYWRIGPRRLFAHVELGEGADRRIELRSWTLPDGPEELLDSLSAAELAGIQNLVAAPDGSGWVMARGSGVFFRPFGGRGPEKLLDVLEAQASVEPFGTTGVLALDQSGNARLWSFGGGGPNRAWSIRRPADATPAVYDAAGLRVASLGPTKQSLLVWERDGLPGAKPLELRRSGSWYDPEFTFLPGGAWCAATTHTQQRLTLWPLARSYPSVVEGYEFPPNRREFAFSPDSHWLATGWKDANVRLLPVGGADPAAVRELGPIDPRYASDIRFDPEGRYLFVVSMVDGWIVPLDGGPCRLVVPKVENRQIEAGAISPSGARVATAYLGGDGPRELYVFDVATGALRSFALPRHDESTGIVDGVGNLEFLDEQTLLTAGWGGVMRWDLATGAYELLVGSPGAMWMAVSRTAGTAVTADTEAGVVLRNLSTGASRSLPQFESEGRAGDLDPSGSVFATGDFDGSIRVGRVNGGEPHLLLGHIGSVTNVAISPDLQWVASAGEDRTLRLWPMPDLSKPPLHTLPHDELLAKLRSFTNLRAVRDPESSTGWRVEIGPFPGWRELPTW